MSEPTYGPFYTAEAFDAFLALDEPCPYPNEYGVCVCCGFRVGVACVCGMTFAERAHTVGIDHEALRRFHGN